MADAMVWPILAYKDAPKAATFMEEAFGFEVAAMYPRESDPGIIDHGELRWPLGGGVMLGTAGEGGDGFRDRPAGSASIYVVCDDPDGLYDRALAAGAELVRDIQDEDYGSRGFTVRDPEGVLWSFGTYRGE